MLADAHYRVGFDYWSELAACHPWCAQLRQEPTLVFRILLYLPVKTEAIPSLLLSATVLVVLL